MTPRTAAGRALLAGQTRFANDLQTIFPDSEAMDMTLTAQLIAMAEAEAAALERERIRAALPEMWGVERAGHRSEHNGLLRQVRAILDAEPEARA